MKAFHRHGQIAMTMVLLVGGIALAAGIGLSFLVASFVNSSYGYQATQRAMAVAAAGTNDALLLLIRDKDFSMPTGYSIPVGNYSALISITQNTPVSGQVTILSQGIVGGYKRKYQTIVQVEPATVEVVVVSSQLVL